MRVKRGLVAAVAGSIVAASAASGCGAGQAPVPAAVTAAELATARPSATIGRSAPSEPPAPQPSRRPILDDAEADQAFATSPDTVLTEKAPDPAAVQKAGAGPTVEDMVSPGAPTDAEIARELAQMDAVVARQAKAGGDAHGITLKRDGTAKPAAGLPKAVAQVSPAPTRSRSSPTSTAAATAPSSTPPTTARAR